MKTGFLSAVPCDHCGQPNNLSAQHANLGGNQSFASGITTETKFECDHCARHNVVTGTFKDPYIWVQIGLTVVSGPASNVPCPQCGNHDNFQGVLSFMPVGDLNGAVNTCVHCDAEQKIVGIKTEMRVRVAAQ